MLRIVLYFLWQEHNLRFFLSFFPTHCLLVSATATVQHPFDHFSSKEQHNITSHTLNESSTTSHHTHSTRAAQHHITHSTRAHHHVHPHAAVSAAGRHVRQDVGEALSYFIRAARQGHADAAFFAAKGIARFHPINAPKCFSTKVWVMSFLFFLSLFRLFVCLFVCWLVGWLVGCCRCYVALFWLF